MPKSKAARARLMTPDFGAGEGMWAEADRLASSASVANAAPTSDRSTETPTHLPALPPSPSSNRADTEAKAAPKRGKSGKFESGTPEEDGRSRGAVRRKRYRSEGLRPFGGRPTARAVVLVDSLVSDRNALFEIDRRSLSRPVVSKEGRVSDLIAQRAAIAKRVAETLALIDEELRAHVAAQNFADVEAAKLALVRILGPDLARVAIFYVETDGDAFMDAVTSTLNLPVCRPSGDITTTNNTDHPKGSNQ